MTDIDQLQPDRKTVTRLSMVITLGELLSRAVALCDESRGPESGSSANEKWEDELNQIKKEIEQLSKETGNT